jgi:hypothetical protein
MRETFGDMVVTEAVRRMAEVTGSAIRGGQQSYTRQGGLLLASVAGSQAVASPVSASRHTFFGEVVR